MAVQTIGEALRAMRQLSHATSGRLVGVSIDDAWRLPGGKIDTKGWPEAFTAQLAAAGADTANPPAYVVLSDATPVCWLTGDGVVATSTTATLTHTQIRHLDQAAQALGDLHRHTLARLADAVDARAVRRDDIAGDLRQDRIGSLRVANPDRPARAWWVLVHADLAESRLRVAEVTGTDQPLIITAYGYGGYGRKAHRLQLEVLCAINQAADRHDLPAAVVGDWLAAEGGLAGLIGAEQIPAAFDAAYIGRFSHELAYTAFRVDELGWEKALRKLGALEFLDTSAFNRHLFTDQVRAIRDSSPDAAGIVVCRRHPDS
jgi:hypothetical protein